MNLFQKIEIIFDFRMQLISHILFVWLMDDGAANISEHPERTARDQSQDPGARPSDTGR